MKFKLLLFLALLLLISCGKEELLKNPDKSVQLRSSIQPNFSISDGIIHFDDNQAFADQMKELIQNERNEETRAELSSLYSSEDFDDHPSCYSCNDLEQANSFISLRKMEQDAKETRAETEDAYIGFIKDEYLKTLLNSDGVISIGKRFYVYLNDSQYAVIANNDRETLSTFLAAKKLGEIQPGYNTRIVNRASESMIFDTATESEVLPNKHITELNIVQKENSDGSITLLNKSFIELEEGTPYFLWKYEDGSTSTGRTPNRTFTYDENVTVKVHSEGSPPGGPPITCGPYYPPVLDSTLTLRACDLGTNAIEFYYNYDPVTCTYTFKNPGYYHKFTVKSTGFSVNWNKDSWSSALLPSGPNEIELCVATPRKSGGYQICCGTFIITPCGGPDGADIDCDEEEGVVEDQQIWYNINGKRWKMEVMVWVESKGLFGGWSRPDEVGSRMTIYKWRKKWGKWKWRDECPDVGHTTLTGEYYDTDEDCAIYNANEFRWRFDCDNNQQINIDHNGARKYAGQLGGTFRMKIDGTWYPYDDGNQLVLN